jgi:ATP-dependent Clp endopeptidase proteolytic subunit ClpP
MQEVHIPVEGIIGSTIDEYGYPMPGFEAWMLDYYVSEETKKVVLHINSDGGSVTGFAIYNKLQHLQESGIEVESIIEGRAYSIATIVALAAGKVRAREASLFMVHKPWLQFATGNADELRKTANALDTHEQPMLSVYAAKSGKSTEDISALLSEERFMTATEAKAYGFIDEVLPVAVARTHEQKAVAFYSPTPIINQSIMKDEEKKTLFAEFKAWLKGEPKAEAEEAPEATAETPAIVAASANTDKGTLYYEGESLEVGTMVFSDEALETAAEDGEYVLESGQTAIVAEGQVTEIQEATEEAPEETPEEETAPDAVAALRKELQALKAQLNAKPNVPGSGKPKAETPQNFTHDATPAEPFAASAQSIRNSYKRRR